MNQKGTDQSASGRVHSSEVAEALRLSITEDLYKRDFNPQNQNDLLTLARWGSQWGYFEAEARAGKERDPRPRLPADEIADWIRVHVSPHPDRFRELVEACRALEKRFLMANVKRLESCGTIWWQQHVLRIFWKDRHGRERLRRQIGIHRCKHAWCPTCGRSRQAQLTADVEKMLILAQDFGFHEGHARLVTLTVPNGEDIQKLREQAHKAFAKLQRTRWWNRHAFGWVRGSEVVTGKDGKWNLHIHLMVLFWSPRVSYQQLSQVWTQELGGPRECGRNYVLDCETLEAKRWARKDGRNGPLKQRGSLVRAARYITKYLAKPEDLKNIKGGPGGLAHLISASKGLRKFAVGGGCSVLRRVAKVLLPRQTFQAEEALAGAYLHEGLPPCRVEEVNPLTGEARDVSVERLQDERQRALERLGEVLETNPVPGPRQALPGRVVGIPAGPKGRYRRLGPLPLAGRSPTVASFEKLGRGALTGFRALLAGGDWGVFRWEELSAEPGKARRYAAVLPRTRYSWRLVHAAILDMLAHGCDEWSGMRRRANWAGAQELVGGPEKLDALRAVFSGLNDTKTRGYGTPTNLRLQKADELTRWRYELLKTRTPDKEEFIARLSLGIDALRRLNPLWSKPKRSLWEGEEH